MRMSFKNKQKMKYALYKERVPVYETDNERHVIYDTDGEPVISGSEKPGYDVPVDFKGHIVASGGEAEALVYGVSIADYDSKLLMAKDAIPIDENSIIFKDSEPEYDASGALRRASADFYVVKVQPSLNQVVYLLKTIE